MEHCGDYSAALKGGGFYGYKLHMAVCARTDLPLAWRVESANHHDALFALPVLDAVRKRPGGAGARLSRNAGGAAA